MRLAVDLAAKTARPGREAAIRLYRGVVARRLEEFVDRGEILAAEPVRRREPVELLGGGRDSGRHPFSRVRR